MRSGTKPIMAWSLCLREKFERIVSLAALIKIHNHSQNSTAPSCLSQEWCKWKCMAYTYYYSSLSLSLPSVGGTEAQSHTPHTDIQHRGWHSPGTATSSLLIGPLCSCLSPLPTWGEQQLWKTVTWGEGGRREEGREGGWEVGKRGGRESKCPVGNRAILLGLLLSPPQGS